MKKIHYLILGFAFIGLSFGSCRKGSEDPFFTFHTRKDRVAGTWQITDYNRELVTKYVYPNTSTNTQKYEQRFGLVNYSETTTDLNSMVMDRNGKISKSVYIFDKSGNWSSVIEYYLYTPQAVAGFYVSKTRIEREGKWEFQGKTDELKKKESMLLEITTERNFDYTYSTYLGTVVDSIADSTSVNFGTKERTEVWKLIGLKTNRMIAEISTSFTYTSSVPSINGTKITDTEKIKIELN